MNQQRTNLGANNFRSSASILENSGVSQLGGAGIPMTTAPPPIPPRRQVVPYQSYNNFSPMASSYLSGGYGGYGSNWNYNRFGTYGGYGGYGSLGYGQNQWGGGPSGDVENRFVQYAEESTRPAFQSIEAMVHTFSSMTMMLESTFFAMTSSFRAILGVAENMGKLRHMLRQFISTFALFRFFKWLYWRVKHLLGVRNLDTSREMLWQQTISEVLRGETEQRGPSSWPIFLFLSILFATPYLIHRLVRNAKNIDIDVKNPKDWMKCKEPVFTANVLYDFSAASNEELSLKVGQKVFLAPQSLQPKNMPGWCRATDSITVGMIPTSYITVVGQLKKKSETVTPSMPSQPPMRNPIIQEHREAEENLQGIDKNNVSENNVHVKSNGGDIFTLLADKD